jgi:transposase-like protein
MADEKSWTGKWLRVEEHGEWEVLLKRLVERGVGAEQGVKMIVRDGCGGLGKALVNVYGSSILDQRCIFHTLKNVADQASTALKGKDQRETKNKLMEQAAHI